jgi:Tol biopolymer transport system component
MSLAAGTRLGPYEVTAPLGVGGMGEVYRARDPRIGRDVAVKVLPASFAADADRLRRFEQEARATGQLNHPNILAVHDFGTHDGAPFVVSELLEGETLRERIGGSALPVRKAIDYAVQIARGLAAAHDKGVVHRDLKPDNVFVTKDGRVKILDFGLAKVVGGDILTEGETNTAGLAKGTDAGKVLGTVGYMSPEQVRAQAVDHRSDIFSFGSVLYEMLSGQRAFRGASAVETMNAILKEDPKELSATNRTLPPALERIVSHCLEKSPEERFQSARDIAFDLEQLSGSSSNAAVTGSAGAAPRWRRAGLLAALALGGVLVGYLARGGPEQREVATFKPITFRTGLVNDARFAPDGKTIAYQALWPDSPPDVYLAQAGSPESRPLGIGAVALGGVSKAGDLLIGRPVGNGTTLAQVPMGGGAPRDVVENVAGGDFGPDGIAIAVLRVAGSELNLEFPPGRVLYKAGSMRHLRVSPDGRRVAFSEHPFVGDFRGDIVVVDTSGKKTTLSADWADVRGLAWSADGSEVWFTATRSGAECALWAVTLDGKVRPVFRGPGSLALRDIAPDGRVLLAVQRRRLQLFGLGPGETKERELSWLDYGVAADISHDGKTLLFQEQGEGGGSEYTSYIRRMDGTPAVRLGKGAAMVLSPDATLALVINLTVPMQAVVLPTGAGEPRVLPRGPLTRIQSGGFLADGRHVVLFGSEEGRSARFYLQDLTGGEPKAISVDGFPAAFSIVTTPDGASIVAMRDGQAALFPVAGGEPRVVAGVVPGEIPLRVSADGRSLFVFDNAYAIFKVDLVRGTRQPWRQITPIGGGPAAFLAAIVISPDGNSYAYLLRDDTSTLYVATGLH